MQVVKTIFEKAMLLKTDSKNDCRGSMKNLYKEDELQKIGISLKVRDLRVYDMPLKGTFFGIHYQGNDNPMNKLIYVTKGRGMDYVVDLREDSPTYLQWEMHELSADNNLATYIPHGFGHAFIALEDNTVQVYVADAYGKAGVSKQINYRDKSIGLELQIPVTSIAEYDDNAPFISVRHGYIIKRINEKNEDCRDTGCESI